MKRVEYVTGSFVTSDAVADALLELVAMLGRDDEARVVHVPSVETDGSTVTVDLVVGPASQVRATAEKTDIPEPESGEALEHLRAMMKTAGPSMPVQQKPAVVDENWSPEL